jgi:DNA (cytosine-5)-methyltransferase 1
MTAYYNENDPYAAQWIRNLIAAGHIADGDVDDRSIADVRSGDLRGYSQCHFFAGIGGWSYGLRLAGWDDARPVWTGSCPCQPFSTAGKGKAADDERHLWPQWFSLIRECRPATVLGEQVEAAIGWGWLDAVFADLEAEGYACGASVLPACGVGAPHIRQRVWFVGQSNRAGPSARSEAAARDGHGHPAIAANRDAGIVADARRSETERQRQYGGQILSEQETTGFGCGRGMGHASSNGLDQRLQRHGEGEGLVRTPGIGGNTLERSGAAPWSDLVWLPCTDGKSRPTQSGIFPLAHGIPGRVGRLRAYGNAIVPQVAADFVKAFIATEKGD